ncbi:MAG: amino acid adenylation domain-containing protein, partial [Methylococcales bacterium]|nr:amino acid adenylation domain-containing protein [Methylococcales bacterium]
VFINMLVMRGDMSGSPRFRDFLRQVKEKVLGAFGHQDLPFEKLVEELSPTRQLSYSPLFQVVLVLQNAPSVAPDVMHGIEVRREFAGAGTSMFDLTFYVYQQTDGLKLTIEYNTDLFEATTIERLVGHYQRLLESIVAEPDCTIDKLPMLEEKERRQLLEDWNATAADYPDEPCIQGLIEAQARSRPEAIAVESEEQTLRYEELSERSNQLAHYLREQGVRPGSLVGICLERSLEMIIGLLGILKAGGAYVPLDPAYPADRIAYMLEDAEVEVLVTQSSLEERLSVHNIQAICLDADKEVIASQSTEIPESEVKAEDLAYVIYTSGSTGKPKGVEIPHRALTNFLQSMSREPGLTAKDVLLAVTTLSFDIAGLELYLPLLVGAKIVLASREKASDGEQLAAQIKTSEVTVMQATPATWRLLLETGWNGQEKLKILCGGEALTRELAEELLKRGDSLWNMYGPTETTIWSAVHQVQPGKGPVSVGHPIGNTRIYILDEQHQPVPIGVAGEMYIAGAGLARGYWKRTALTAERFVEAAISEGQKTRLYRTGDLGRYRNDGTIEVLGRIDFQVKIRGFRIELGEIEAVLGQQPGVKQAVVVTREETEGDKRLVAYWVAETTEQPTVAELRAHLKEQLPEYMIPAAYVILEAFPLTPNGKIDHKLLPKPEQSDANFGLESTYCAPRTPIEETLIAIWSDVLEIEKIGIYDDFFDLGG